MERIKKFFNNGTASITGSKRLVDLFTKSEEEEVKNKKNMELTVNENGVEKKIRPSDFIGKLVDNKEENTDWSVIRKASEGRSVIRNKKFDIWYYCKPTIDGIEILSIAEDYVKPTIKEVPVPVRSKSGWSRRDYNFEFIRKNLHSNHSAAHLIDMYGNACLFTDGGRSYVKKEESNSYEIDLQYECSPIFVDCSKFIEEIKKVIDFNFDKWGLEDETYMFYVDNKTDEIYLMHLRLEDNMIIRSSRVWLYELEKNGNKVIFSSALHPTENGRPEWFSEWPESRKKYNFIKLMCDKCVDYQEDEGAPIWIKNMNSNEEGKCAKAECCAKEEEYCLEFNPFDREDCMENKSEAQSEVEHYHLFTIDVPEKYWDEELEIVTTTYDKDTHMISVVVK